MLHTRRQFRSEAEHTALAAATRLHTCSSARLRPHGQRPPSLPWTLSSSSPLLLNQRAWCARVSNRAGESAQRRADASGLHRPFFRKLDSMDCGSDESVFCFFESFPPPEPAQRPVSSCTPQRDASIRNGPTCATSLAALRLLVQVLVLVLVEVSNALCTGGDGLGPLDYCERPR
jgi:hypothetical protein